MHSKVTHEESEPQNDSLGPNEITESVRDKWFSYSSSITNLASSFVTSRWCLDTRSK